MSDDWAACAPPMLDEPYRQMSLELLSDVNATVAKVRLTAYDGQEVRRHEATGSSGRERGDSYDREIGDTLAIARSLETLAAKLHKEARGRVNAAANLRRHKEEIKARKASLEDSQARTAETIRSLFSVPAPLVFSIFDAALRKNLPNSQVISAPVAEDGMITGLDGKPAGVSVADIQAAMNAMPVDVDYDSGTVVATAPQAGTTIGVQLRDGTGRTVKVDDLGVVHVLDKDGNPLREFYA